MMRARVVDEQLASMAKQLAPHDSVLAKLDSLCSIVQHHSYSFKFFHKSNAKFFDLLRHSMASQQAIMAG